MNVWLRRIGIVVGSLLVVLILAGAAVYAVSSARLGAEHEATPHPFGADSGDPANGEHLVATYGCADCHGENLGGTMFLDGMPFARVAAPNLTSGRADGGLSDEQWELAVRHGIGTDGRGLFIMPSQEYVYLSDRDLGDIVAYVRTLPPVTDELPQREFGPVGRTLVTLGRVRLAPALMHDDARHLPAPEKAPTQEFGYYLTRLCTGCHGMDLAGGQPGDPEAPPAPNLTPAGNLGSWTFEQFEHAMRTGVTPDGRQLNPQYMPWTAIGNATDTELRAIWEYLAALESVVRQET